MKKIILDTNFLMIPLQFNIDIFSEIDRVCVFKYQLLIIDKTIDELEKISGSAKRRYRLAAKIALQLIKKKKIKKIKTKDGKVDDLILEALGKDDVLATQDALLRKRAVEKGANVIFLRNKSHLVLA